MTLGIKYSSILILIFFFFVHNADSITVVKCETSPAFIFSEYKIYLTSDFITPYRELILNGKVDKPGVFSFEVDNDKVCVLDIEINDFKKTFFIDKNSEYIIKFEESQDNHPIIISEPVSHINSEIFSLIKLFDTLNYIKGVKHSREYTMSGYIILGIKKNLKLMKKLIDSASGKLQGISNTFLTDYFIYYLAPYKAILITKNFDIDSLINFKNRLFNIDPVKFSNPSYIECLSFFTSDINKYIYLQSTKAKNRDFSFESYYEFSSNFLKPEVRQLSKLIFLNNKMDNASYYNNKGRVKNLLQLSDSIADNSKFNSVITVASNLKKKYGIQNKLNIPAPLFNLPDRNGDTISLSNFIGKYVYIDFWAVWCNHCREHHKELSLDTVNGKTYLPASLQAFNSSWLGTRKEGNVDCIVEFPKMLNVMLNKIDPLFDAPTGDSILVWAGNPSYQGLSKRYSVGENKIRILDAFGRYEGKFVIQLFANRELQDERVVNLKPGTARLISKVVVTPETDKAPQGMVEIPATNCYIYRVEKSEDNHFIPYPELTDSQEVTIDKFFMDKFPVTNAKYKKFITATNYHPKDSVNYLKNWKNGTFPEGKGNYPVVYVSKQDAEAYAHWAGKRLPTEIEWQYAGQGNDSLSWSWGHKFDSTKCNNASGKLTPVDAFPQGQSKFGVLDMVGNVWQITNDVYDDGSYYLEMIRGGSYYKPAASWWYVKGGPQPLNHRQVLLMVSPGFDRNATVGFRCVKDAN